MFTNLLEYHQSASVPSSCSIALVDDHKLFVVVWYSGGMVHSFGINIPDPLNERIEAAREKGEPKGHRMLDSERMRLAAEDALDGTDTELTEELLVDALSQYIDQQRTLTGEYGAAETESQSCD